MDKKKIGKGKIKKAIAILSAFVLYTTSTFGATFKDVPSTHWAFTAVSDMQKRGIMLPNSSGEFFPNNTMNYFETADVLAKATGYVDVNINKTVDAAFKQQIINNYEKQKATLAVYENKFKSWDKLYNQQIAYLLGRGYLQSEIDKFIVVGTDKKETKRVLTKQDFAVFVVRILGKEQTAKSTYKVSGFKDDSLISEANKPYAGYLKAIGIMKADSAGAFSPNTKVTRAFAAKVLSDALSYKEKQSAPSAPAAKPETQTSANNLITIKNIIAKSESTEYWVVYEKNSKTGFGILKNTTKVTDKNGNEVAALSIPLKTQAVITTTVQNSTEYITSMQLQTETESVPVLPDSMTISGKIARIGSNGVVSIFLSDESTKTYVLDANCIVMLDGIVDSLDNIKEDYNVTATIASNAIIKLDARTSSLADEDEDSERLTNAVITAKSVKKDGYELTVKQGSKTSELFIDGKVEIKKNKKKSDAEEIRIGDEIEIVREEGKITQLNLSGKRTNVTGKVRALYIAAVPEITLEVDNKEEKYVISDLTEIYDSNIREDVSIREIRLGQKVELCIESKEVTSLVIQKGTSSVKYKGEIVAVGKKFAYIDVQMDYDPITGESQVIKRVQTPLEVKIEEDGNSEHRTSLKKGMDIVVTFKYEGDIIPEKILILE